MLAPSRAWSARRVVLGDGRLVRALAKKAKAPEKAGAAPPPPPSGSGVVRGANILKDGADPPILPDSEYPDWLWTIHQPNPPFEELLERAERDGVDSLGYFEQRLLLRGYSKKRIKEHNAERGK
ncbi:hypothetical protein EMIHUDRAFT_204961 [Emiliania huxleyi CCMP1516]|uniref:Large ribosomal subunit protein mL54 n=2 Tax=Emiliania huxleyi TaxID=2903 RepID=A0A0D3JU82_EMIH1|nr:hypothetical protein EMIHUDRAFT_204961 [Emiliania huxleyi CCMP1516]EOD27067.1 hypothetical protein EMIHUDRAFT_204961 [Emiliania huxleyi CCMP1516]|eukprot:XP_005779496.1 hypothetical protein EMIHUDRAFT_204961 [Emiliania huxleyi CCMP1516]